MAIHELFAYLRPKPAGEAIEFYKTVFGATEKFRLSDRDGRVGHAQLLLGGTTLMLSDAYPEFGIHAQQHDDGPISFVIHLHVDDADALIDRAVAAGAQLLRPPQDHFYGERSGTVRDPFGYDWLIGHSIETLEPEEIQRRFDAMLADQD